LYHSNLICVSPKHGMHGSLRCLKIVYIDPCWTYFFFPKPLWNSDDKNYETSKDFFYRSVITFCSKIIFTTV